MYDMIVDKRYKISGQILCNNIPSTTNFLEEYITQESEVPNLFTCPLDLVGHLCGHQPSTGQIYVQGV